MCIITGLLTGHVAVNRYLTVMKLPFRAHTMCHKCEKEEKTANHLLGRCSAMTMARYSILVSHLMDIMELQQVQPHSFEVCKSLKEICVTFRLPEGCTLGPN